VGIVVRGARAADADGIGEANVRAWQAAYPGLLPQDYLDGLRVEDRAGFWREVLRAADPRRRVLVADVAGRVAGFCDVCVAPADPPSPATGELRVINVHPDHWGAGVGGALLTAAEGALAGLGHRVAQLWVLPGNHRARAIYEHRGWTADGTSRIARGTEVSFPQVRYLRRIDGGA
jgi:GNAT superfamily N-acetyltransferase